MRARHWYAEYRPYGTDTMFRGDSCHRFATKALRDEYVRRQDAADEADGAELVGDYHAQAIDARTARRRYSMEFGNILDEGSEGWPVTFGVPCEGHCAMRDTYVRDNLL